MRLTVPTAEASAPAERTIPTRVAAPVAACASTRVGMNAATEQVDKPVHPAVAAALALPPMSAEACAEVGRIFAAIERRHQQCSAEQKSEVA